jgi:hypothetical protein
MVTFPGQVYHSSDRSWSTDSLLFSPPSTRPASPNRSTDRLLPTQPPEPAYCRSRSPNRPSSPLYGSSECPTPVKGNEENLVDEKVYLPKLLVVSPLIFVLQKRLSSESFSVTSFHCRFDESVYEVERLADHDDSNHLSRPRKILHGFSPLFVFLAMGAYFLYYTFRVHCILSAQKAYKEVHVMAWMFVTAEAFVACEYNEICKCRQTY